VSDTWDAEDQAIARALGAASEAETRDADERLIDEYRDVLAHLPVPEIEPRADLEDRVLSAALARRAAPTPSIERARDDRNRNRNRNRIRVAVLAITTAAAAVVIGLIVTAQSSSSPTAGGRIVNTTYRGEDVQALLRTPGARVADLGPSAGKVVVVPDGRSAIYDVPATQTDPLVIGLVSKGGTTLLGPVRADGGTIAFSVTHPERVTAVTLQDAGRQLGTATLTPA